MQDSLEDFIQLTRNVKQDETSKVNKELQITAQFKKDSDSRAMKIVEFSIEGKLRPEVFIKCLPFINQGYYQDIVEERAITKLCGYPVCGKKIPDMPKKQYLISSKSNKIYDITERKNFCSNFCYTASLHIKKQIDTNPLWLRKLEDIPEYNLLRTSEGGLPGEYIDQGIVKLVASVKQSFTPISSFTEVGLADLIDKEIKSGNLSRDRPKSFKKSSKLKNTMQTINENEVIQEQQNKMNKDQSKTNKVKKEVKESVINEVATCKKDVHKKGVVINLPAIEENEEQKENSLDKSKSLDENNKKCELKENININNKISALQIQNKVGKLPDEERLKSIDFVNKIEELIPNKTDESSTKKDLIHDIKTTANNPVVKHKQVQENNYPQVSKLVKVSSMESASQSADSSRKIEIDKSKNKLDLLIAKSKIGSTRSKDSLLVNTVNEKSNETEREVKQKDKLKSSKISPDIKILIKNTLNSWLSLDTCIYIHGESKVKEILTENKMSDYFEELNIIDMRREQQMKYMAICRKLQFQEMADDKFHKGATENHKLQPLPDYNQLKQETKDLTLKVKSFLYGEMYEEEDKNFPNKINKKEEETEGAPAVLPPVDFNNQNLMRRKIFLMSLNKAMHQLLQSLGMSYYSPVLLDLPVLVKTFTLRADNITFKPAVWTYIALVLLHMLALRHAGVREEIEDPRAQEYIQMLCEVVSSNQTDFISDILSDVENIELFVQNYIKKAATV